MLGEKLEQLAAKRKAEQLCALGIEIQKMSKEDIESLSRAMRSEVVSTDILQVLREEGINSFGISHLREKRNTCFGDSPCYCIRKAMEAKK